jgi:hypothetical protein
MLRNWDGGSGVAFAGLLKKGCQAEMQSIPSQNIKPFSVLSCNKLLPNYQCYTIKKRDLIKFSRVYPLKYPLSS